MYSPKYFKGQVKCHFHLVWETYLLLTCKENICLPHKMTIIFCAKHILSPLYLQKEDCFRVINVTFHLTLEYCSECIRIEALAVFYFLNETNVCSTLKNIGSIDSTCLLE